MSEVMRCQWASGCAFIAGDGGEAGWIAHRLELSASPGWRVDKTRTKGVLKGARFSSTQLQLTTPESQYLHLSVPGISQSLKASDRVGVQIHHLTIMHLKTLGRRFEKEDDEWI